MMSYSNSSVQDSLVSETNPYRQLKQSEGKNYVLLQLNLN